MTALLPSLRDRISQPRTSQAERGPDDATLQPGPGDPVAPGTDPQAARRKVLRERFVTWLPLVLVLVGVLIAALHLGLIALYVGFNAPLEAIMTTAAGIVVTGLGAVLPWTRPEGVVLPGAYLSATGLSLPSIHPDHLLLVRATALGPDRAPAIRAHSTANGGSS